MAKDEIIFQPIGMIYSPHQELAGMPIQPASAAGVKGTVVVDPAFEEGLKDLDGFSHVILVYYFHQAKLADLLVKPFLDDSKHGVFATRAPRRPNGIGISVVKLLAVEGNILSVENLDVVDGTPLLDIKPYVSDFDKQEGVRIGWLEKSRGKIDKKMSDNRFID
ncbi:MAG: tRNA (N6-threonylcarbamoyladenosine(37)-N6)-methyltransferase TrmO [Anaerolineales bacterium]|nr:tRNA (N6-threonylcarbamoyladenosine(37)-N6)-methyltransferase TrmO [Anaerolineales bacterium]